MKQILILTLCMCVLLLLLLSPSSGRKRKVWTCTDGKCACADDDTDATTKPSASSPSNSSSAPSVKPVVNNTASTTTKKPPVPHQARLCTPEPCWTYYAHGTSATDVTFPTPYEIKLSNFKYDGKGGPFVHWMMSLDSKDPKKALEPCKNYQDRILLRTSDANCWTLQALPEFDGTNDMEILLPGEVNLPSTGVQKVTWNDVDWIGLYNLKRGYLLGFVKIPNNPTIISMTGTPTVPGDCESEMRKKLFDYEPAKENSTINGTNDFVKCTEANTFELTGPSGKVEYVE